MTIIINPHNRLLEILNFLETITSDKIILTNHFTSQNNKRHNNNIYKDTLLYKKLVTEESPVEISLQPHNKIRVKYFHPYCKYYDYCIVFVIENKNMILITTFNTPTKRRIGDEFNGHI